MLDGSFTQKVSIMNQAKVIAIMGPTASGKTAAALEIAKHIPSEIISVDSALVYRDMNIGTAKPSAEELASAPHHLIDIIDPAESYSVAHRRPRPACPPGRNRSRHRGTLKTQR